MTELPYNDVVIKFINQCKENDEPVSLAEFVKKRKGRGRAIYRDWRRPFAPLAKQLNIQVAKSSSVNWGEIALSVLRSGHLLKNNRSQQTSLPAQSATVSSSNISSPSQSNTSSSNLGRKLNDVDRDSIAQIYNSLDENQMWKLSTGTIVEKQMEKLTLDCNYEHQTHSLIMDCSLTVWNDYFTKEELDEIRNYNPIAIRELPSELNDYIRSYLGKHTLEELDEHNDKFKFDRIKEPEQYWIHQTITKTLDMYFYKYLQDKDRTESDMLRRIWGFIDCCFDSSKIKFVGGEKASEACSMRLNESRDPAAVQAMERKRIGTKTDMLFKSRSSPLELGTCETGKHSSINSSKSIDEASLKCPKTMKDMLLQLVKESPQNLRKLSTYGFTISGLYIKLIVTDFPAGYVCRVSKLPEWLQFPTSEVDCVKKLIPIVHTVWHAKVSMESMLDIAGMDSNIPTLSFTPRPTLQIPPCFTSSTQPASRKRKYKDAIQNDPS
ncbi:hypothetical protein BJV82DRAFT_620372 [Fennellomyces sp. T-0311]|nr:hypothetical protein BJV82DRAFT_620372 [Fennellomyces sp. T-0311]